MPDRRRAAVVLTPLLALLAALLAGWGVAAAQAPDPLTLTIAAERSECTAGTLNPVSWEISGGTPPYTLTIDGAPMDADAEGATVLCGALPRGASEAPATFMAVVTGANGAQATARAAYTIVPPLPAPVAMADVDVMRFSVKFAWRALTVPASCDMPTGCFAFRTRLAEETSWDYSWDEHRNADWDWPPLVYRTVASGTTVEAGIASIRHPIEIETPDALRWSATAQATSLTDISGLTATATHDTVTVRWNRQPSAHTWGIGIGGPDVRGGQAKRIASRGPAEWVAGWGDPAGGTHEVTFTGLPPDTEYHVFVSGPRILEAGPAHIVQATTTVRTAVAPPDYTPLLRGPQNLRATATHDTITVSWDHPHADTQDDYVLGISSPLGSVPIRHQNARVFPPASQYTYTDLDPGSTYRIVVMHNDITREGAAITITTKAAPRLRLVLTAERSECTAGTLNPVRWTITGGAGPYRLTVDGQSVDPTAESVTVTCGSLPQGVNAAAGTITAFVRDRTGASVTARAAYTIVPPLPAPTGIVAYAQRTSIGVMWDRVSAAGPVPELGADCPCPLYLRRWRISGTEVWTTRLTQDRNSNSGQTNAGSSLLYLSEGTTYELAVATLRDAIEQDTTEALTWSPTVTVTTVAPPTGVRATATHDTVTVSWDSQSAAPTFTISLRGPQGSASQTFIPDGATPHQVVFRDLPPETEYTARVWADVGRESPYTESTVSTATPPTGWTPPKRGPQNVRTSVTHNSVTVDWDAPYEGANDVYHVFLFHTGADREPVAGDRREHKLLYGAGVTQHTFTGLEPATTYRIDVGHPDIVSGWVKVAVTTLAAPAARSPSPTPTCVEYLVGAMICA